MNAIDWLRVGPNTRMSEAYVELVKAIFAWARMYKSSPEFTDCAESIRALSSYLLLKTHPYTGKTVKSDKERSVIRTSDRYQELCETTNRILPGLINSIDKEERDVHNAYPVLTRVLELCELGTYTREDEDVALSILGLWHIDQSLEICYRMSAQACASLYGEHLANPASERSDWVYLHDSLRYLPWISNEIDRMYTMGFENSHIYREVSYLGAFASLIRAVRMCGNRNSELNTYLSEELELLMSKVKPC